MDDDPNDRDPGGAATANQNRGEFFTAGRGPWKERLAFVVEMMRDISRHIDPQELVRAYGSYMNRIMEVDRFVSISRRDLAAPWYRITRSDLTDPEESIKPWKQRDQLPCTTAGCSRS